MPFVKAKDREDEKFGENEKAEVARTNNATVDIATEESFITRTELKRI